MQHHGSPWTHAQRQNVVDLLGLGWSPTQIAHKLRTSGSERSVQAIARFANRVQSSNPPAVQGHLQGHLQGHPPNIIPPIYQPDAPPPPVAPIVPQGESRVGVIGDTHLPFDIDGYLDFCRSTFERWDVNTIVHVGDLLDNHAISFHKPDPDGRSAGDEYETAIAALQPWYKAFPHVRWVTGNHDALPQRRLYDACLPANMLRGNYYQAPPGWSNAESFEVDGVLYTHGIGCGGINGHRILAQKRGVSCVIGHIHMTAGVAYTSAHDGEQRFGLAVGCGVDHKSYGMAYARYFGRPALGCGVVLGGQEAHFIPMLTGRR